MTQELERLGQSRTSDAQDAAQAASPSLATRAVHGGPDPGDMGGLLNPPVHRASTIIFKTVDAYRRRHDGFYDDVIYGLYGTETTFALARAVADLEGGYQSVITSSGSAAVALALAAFTSAGDHILVSDVVYGHTRRFCQEAMVRYGVEVTYFDPLVGGAIADLVRPNTRAIFMESPGSHTFEVSDVPAICAVARKHGIVTMIDNTWATPIYFRPIEHGVDVSIAAATKYMAGHSDVMLGAMTAGSEEIYQKLKDSAGRWGVSASPDDCYLVHRGLRTLPSRLRHHERTAKALIEWLQGQPEVLRILYPALESDPGHKIWKRDFDGASGLFGVVMKPMDDAAIDRFFNHFSVFLLGSSWGSYVSLAVPAAPPPVRLAGTPPLEGTLVRFHAGLEDPADLIADLERAFARLRSGAA